MSLQIAGFSDTYKVPVFAAKLEHAVGPLSSSAGGLRCLLVGMKTSAGTMTADLDVLGPYTTVEQVDTVAGIGSELSIMAEAALKLEPNVKLYVAAATEPGGGTAATFTIVVSGTWTTAGEVAVRIKGKRIPIAIPSTYTIDDVGAAIAAAINATLRLPFTAAYNSGTDTVTGTCRNKGARGRDWIIAVETTLAPAGMVLTLTGSAAVAGGTRVRAGAAATGVGTDDITTILTKLQGQRWARIGAAQNDATQAALWEANSVAKEGNPVAFAFEDLVFGHNGASSAAVSLGQTTLNAFCAQLYAKRNSETHPMMLAAAMAAYRSVQEGGAAESGGWVPDYDGLDLTRALPADAADAEADSWTTAEQDILLNAGVTPVTGSGGATRVVRAITTYSLLGGTVADDRCLDIGDRVFPVNAIYDRQSLYRSFREANKYVGPNTLAEEEKSPSGVGTPDMWVEDMKIRDKQFFKIGYLEELVDPTGEWNRQARRIMSTSPWVVRRVQHSIGVIGRQQSPSA